MNSLFLMLLLSGPHNPAIITHVEADQIFQAYLYNDALVDAQFQDKIVEIRGRVDSVKRHETDQVGPPATVDWGAAPVPTDARAAGARLGKIIAYDAVMPVHVRLNNNSQQQFHIRCRFPDSSRERLAGLTVPGVRITVRGRCGGLAQNAYLVGTIVHNGTCLTLDDCELVEIPAEPKTPAADDAIN
jgi:hypothetical protein